MTLPALKSDPLSRLAEEAKARFIKILEATTDVVAMMDRTGRLLYLNIAGRRLFGWTEDEEAETHKLEEMHPSWAYEVIRHEAIPTAMEIGCWSGEAALRAEGGREIPILQVILAHTDSSGEVEFLSTICRDISERKQKELEQIEWANRYDAAIRASGQLLFDWDSVSGEITYGGDVASLFGCAGDGLAGGMDRLRQFIVPEDLPGFDAAIEAVLLTRDPFRHEFRMRWDSGRELIVNAQGFFFLDRLGRIGRMVGFLKDVTVERTAESAIQIANERLEQRVAERTQALERAAVELQDNARQQEAVAKLGQVALFGLDLPGLLKKAVETVRSVLRADMASVLDFSPDAGVFVVRAQSGWPSEESPPFIKGGMDSQSGYTLRSGKPVVSRDFEREDRFHPSECVRKAGCRSGISAGIQAGERPLGVLCAFSREVRDYSSDEVSFLQSVAYVITSAIERNRVEEDARKAQKDAEAANRAKSEFLSRMSHELRTPLNAILGFTQILEMDAHTPAQAESIQHISRAGANLLALINEVLDIARIESGRMQFHLASVDLIPLLREASAISAPLASSHAVSIQTAGDLPACACISADAERLKQVFLNLISNAVKFNRPEGTVTIAVNRGEDDFWRINVTDTGHGISEEQLDRVFLPFDRLATTERGTGLGLTLSKKLVCAFNGRIGATSAVGKGSTFWVEFPAIEPPAPQPRDDDDASTLKPAPKSATVQRKKLLYIEDDIANFYLLERIISTRDDIELLPAIQGSIGIDLAREHRPQAILLDMNLPDMTGEQVLQILKADPSTAAIPVIVVTGGLALERPELIHELGAVDILAKPYRIDRLLTLLDSVLA